jgi:hypothetical protein
MRAPKEGGITCRHCETTLAAVTVNETAFLTNAVRERFARDVRRDVGRPRFLRETPRFTD